MFVMWWKDIIIDHYECYLFKMLKQDKSLHNVKPNISVEEY